MSTVSLLKCLASSHLPFFSNIFLAFSYLLSSAFFLFFCDFLNICIVLFSSPEKTPKKKLNRLKPLPNMTPKGGLNKVVPGDS